MWHATASVNIVELKMVAEQSEVNIYIVLYIYVQNVNKCISLRAVKMKKPHTDTWSNSLKTPLCLQQINSDSI